MVIQTIFKQYIENNDYIHDKTFHHLKILFVKVLNIHQSLLLLLIIINNLYICINVY